MPDIFIDDNQTELTSPPVSPPANPVAEQKPEIVKTHESHADQNKSHKHLHLFTGYCDNPKSVMFGDQQEHEILLLLLRRHFVTNLPWIIKAVLLALIPLVIEIIFATGLISFSQFTPETKIVIYSFYYFLLISGYMFVNYITWFYNISIVTNVRIMDVDYSNIIVEDVAATKLTQVEDVSYSQVGIIRSIFDYGDIRLQTAGTASNFEFLGVPHPERVIKIINNLIGKTSHA